MKWVALALIAFTVYAILVPDRPAPVGPTVTVNDLSAYVEKQNWNRYNALLTTVRK